MIVHTFRVIDLYDLKEDYVQYYEFHHGKMKKIITHDFPIGILVPIKTNVSEWMRDIIYHYTGIPAKQYLGKVYFDDDAYDTA